MGRRQPTDRVSLRGLTIKGIAFGGSNGIRDNTGASVTIENCAVRNHAGDGIQMETTSAAARPTTRSVRSLGINQPPGRSILAVVQSCAVRASARVMRTSQGGLS